MNRTKNEGERPNTETQNKGFKAIIASVEVHAIGWLPPSCGYHVRNVGGAAFLQSILGSLH